MARLYSLGFEENTATDLVETRITGSPSIQTSIVRSGTYAARFTGMSNNVQKMVFPKFIANAGSGVNGPLYLRAYFYFTTFPSADNCIMSFGNEGSTQALIRVTSSGTLKLESSSGSQIGSSSSALNTGEWYRVELMEDASPASGSRVMRARLNGSEFAAATNLTTEASAMNQFKVGANVISESQTQGDWYVDDIALNDSSGSTQNSYPGDSKLLTLRPSATGDADNWSSGGVNATGTAWDDIDEFPPNTSNYAESNTLNQEFLVNVGASGLSGSDTINSVEIHCRYAGAGASSNATFKLEAEKTGSGTISQGAALSPANTSYQTNDNQAGPPQLVLMTDPDGSAWTSTTLDSMQVGAKITTTSTNAVRVTAIWVVVDYVPGAVADLSASPSESITLSESKNVALVHTYPHASDDLNNWKRGVKIY